MQALKAVLPRTVSRHEPFIPKDLVICPFVFVRHDAVRVPLQAPYDGPLKVLHRADKYFILDVNECQESVSIDRLKPAYMMISRPLHQAQNHMSPAMDVKCGHLIEIDYRLFCRSWSHSLGGELMLH